MNSSGIKRGLAVSAVSALALAGLAISPAQAQTIDVTQDTTGPTLYTPTATGEYSTKVDGNGNTTVTLLATSGKTIGGQTVNTIRFWTPANPALLDVHVPVVGGVASYQWAAPANVGAAVQVRADAEAAGNLSLGFTTQNVDTTSPNGNQSVSISGANRDMLGLYFKPGSITTSVTGKTGTAGAPTVKVAGPGTASTGTTTITSGPDSNGLSGYQSVLTVNPNNLHDVNAGDDGTTTDDLVVTADNAEDADGRVFSVYHQIVPNGGATALVRAGSTANVFGDVPDSYHPAPDGNANNDRTYYNIKVVDQFGKPVIGVPVFEADPNGTANGLNVGGIVTNFTTGTGNASSGTTATDGTVQARLDEGTMDINIAGNGDQDPASGVQATYYVVDVNASGAYENGVDYLLKVSQTNLPAAPATIEMTNDLGTAMDDDESSPFHVKVLDSDGNGINNTAVNVQITVTDLTTNTQLSQTGQLGVTNSSGVYNTNISLAGYNNKHVKVTIKASTTNGTNSTFELEGDRAQVVWQPSHLQGAVGSQVEAKGVLQLPSGKKLKGRTIALNLTPGTGSPADARFPTSGQPAGTVAGTPTTATATTGDGGAYSVFLKDGATNGQELTDKITATSPGLEIISDYSAAPSVVGTYPTNVATVDFLRSFVATKVEIRSYGTNALDSLFSPITLSDNDQQPGKLGLGNVLAYNADGAQLYNVDVPVTINEGNFVNPASLYDPAPVPGGEVGEWSSVGKSFTANTGDTGKGVFVVNIERNEGFDDNGLVADKVIAGTGNASFEHDFNWNTRDIPLNSGSFSVELADDQESSILPKARAGNSEAWSFDGTGQQVFYDVVATDQFGNRTEQPLTIDDDSPVADFISSFDTQYTLDDPAITAYSKSAADQSLEVELDDQTSTLYTDDPYDSSFDPTDPTDWTILYDTPSADIQEDTDAINWYALNYGSSVFTLTHEGDDTVAAGTQVTNVLTAKDQEGQLIEGVPVGFLRVGPSDDGDDDGQPGDFTNVDGEAFYDWAGNMAGLADVTAVIYNDNEVRQFVVGPDKITFTGEKREHINLEVTGKGGKKDKITANAKSNAAGAVAVLKSKGEVLRTHALNASGDYTFTVTDHNGKKITNYTVVVKQTASTKQASKKIGIK